MRLDLRRVQKIMDRQGMTQRELSARSGIHEVTLSRILCNKTTPRYRTIKHIQRALDVDISAIEARPATN